MQALKGVVILMTVTIAVLMTLIVYGMYQKSQNPEFKFFALGGDTKTAAATSGTANDTAILTPPTSTHTQAFGDITLALPAGAHITSATVSGERLIIVVSDATQGHEQVWVIDLATGKILGRVITQEAP